MGVMEDVREFIFVEGVEFQILSYLCVWKSSSGMKRKSRVCCSQARNRCED